MPTITNYNCALFEPDKHTPFCLAASQVLHMRDAGMNNRLMLLKFGEYYLSIVATTVWLDLMDTYYKLTKKIKLMYSIDEPEAHCDFCNHDLKNVDGVHIEDKSLDTDAVKMYMCEYCYSQLNKRSFATDFDNRHNIDFVEEPPKPQSILPVIGMLSYTAPLGESFSNALKKVFDTLNNRKRLACTFKFNDFIYDIFYGTTYDEVMTAYKAHCQVNEEE